VRRDLISPGVFEVLREVSQKFLPTCVGSLQGRPKLRTRRHTRSLSYFIFLRLGMVQKVHSGTKLCASYKNVGDRGHTWRVLNLVFFCRPPNPAYLFELSYARPHLFFRGCVSTPFPSLLPDPTTPLNPRSCPSCQNPSPLRRVPQKIS